MRLLRERTSPLAYRVISANVPLAQGRRGGRAELARVEAAVFVAELVRRFSRLRTAGEAQRTGTVFRASGTCP
jgi:cytochrome P450